MNMTVLDKNLNAVLILDAYQSLIWTDRYWSCGDFELYTSVDEQLLRLIKCDYYLTSPESDRVMCIDTIRISADMEVGDHMTLRGDSLEKILARRIIWEKITIAEKTPEEAIEILLNGCIINPANTKRKIDNFIFKKSNNPAITGLAPFTAEYSGDNLYDIIVSICKTNKIGFKITLNDNKQFVFELYAGVDRSYNQDDNSFVVFSPDFDNLITANYMETRSSLKNVALVGTTEVDINPEGSSGIDRRELFVDSRSLLISSEDSLTQRGKERLAEYTDISSFDGQAETRLMFKYEQDFFVGDIVQFADGYGHEASARIVEIITSDSEAGVSVYPTFETIQKEGA